MELMENVLMADIYPDPNNPRKDFGDLDALAASFDLNSANPGEPVNPIVVVRDGARYRIVDGERRYRAMLKRKRIACCAVVCDDYDDAASAIQMLATNDKMELTDVERSRGFQQMLILGVDDARAEKAAGVSKGTAKRVRKARSAIADPQACEQLTIERLEAVAEFSDDEAAVEELLSSSENSWRYKLENLRRLAKKRKSEEELRGAAADLGIELLEEKPGGNLVNMAFYRNAKSLREACPDGLEDGFVAVFDKGTPYTDCGIGIWCDASQAVESEKDRAEREIKEDAERTTDGFNACIAAHWSYIAQIVRSVGFEAARTRFPMLWTLVLEETVDGKDYDRSGVRTLSKAVMAFNEAAGSDFDIEWTAGMFCAALYSLYPDIDEYEVRYAVRYERGDIDGSDNYYIPQNIRKALMFAEVFAEDGLQIPPEEQRVYDAWSGLIAETGKGE